MFPAGFNADNEMFASTRFGDFPHRLPTRRWQSPDELFTGWMLLSYKKKVTASSVLNDILRADKVADENPRTFWVAARNRPGETLTMDLGRAFEVRAVQVNFTEYQSDIFASDSTVYTQFRILTSPDGRNWSVAADLTGEKRDRPCAYLELRQPRRARYVRYEHAYCAVAASGHF